MEYKALVQEAAGHTVDPLEGFMAHRNRVHLSRSTCGGHLRAFVRSVPQPLAASSVDHMSTPVPSAWHSERLAPDELTSVVQGMRAYYEERAGE